MYGPGDVLNSLGRDWVFLVELRQRVPLVEWEHWLSSISLTPYWYIMVSVTLLCLCLLITLVSMPLNILLDHFNDFQAQAYDLGLIALKAKFSRKELLHYLDGQGVACPPLLSGPQHGQHSEWGWPFPDLLESYTAAEALKRGGSVLSSVMGRDQTAGQHAHAHVGGGRGWGVTSCPQLFQGWMCIQCRHGKSRDNVGHWGGTLVWVMTPLPSRVLANTSCINSFLS